MPLVIHDLEVILFSLFSITLVGACLSNILLTCHTKVSSPKFTSIFSVTNDQSSSLSSALKSSSLKFSFLFVVIFV